MVTFDCASAARDLYVYGLILGGIFGIGFGYVLGAWR